MSSEKLAEIKALQADEIEALASIYGSDWKIENENGNVFSIVVAGESPERVINLQITFSAGYPLLDPPIYEISAPWLKRDEKTDLCGGLEMLYSEHIGESIIFMWIEKLKEYLDSYETKPEIDSAISSNLITEDIITDIVSLDLKEKSSVDVIPINHGQPITDRRSTFQAHLAVVVSIEQVKEVTKTLLDNRKIASATHNVSAYRIFVEPRKSYLQDYDDDGETHAGSRLLHLLQILDVKNVLIVVSRWYGGIQLGPDRFKHINNVARDILKQNKLIPDQKEDVAAGGKSKKKKGRVA